MNYNMKLSISQRNYIVSDLLDTLNNFRNRCLSTEDITIKNFKEKRFKYSKELFLDLEKNDYYLIVSILEKFI
jgi:hypothetical protein